MGQKDNSHEKNYNPNVTNRDLDTLRKNKKNIHTDGGDDQQLRDREERVDFRVEELDVPGRNKAQKENGNKLNDEENKLHSRGRDDNDNLEQDRII